MSDSELPGLGTALAFVLVGLPFLVPAVRRARRILPIIPRPEHRWPRGEAAAVIALPFVVTGVLGFFVEHPREGEVTSLAVLVALVASQLVFGLAAGLAVLFAARRANGLAVLGLVARRPRKAFGTVLLVYLAGIPCAMGLGLAWTHVCRARGWEEQQEVVRLIVGLERRELLVAALVAALVGPFLEELLFRGFLQSFLEQVLGARAALVVTAALFAGLHGVAGLPVLFLLALFLGWLQQRTRSLWVPWSAHALFNGVSLTIALCLRGAVEGFP